MKSNRIESWLSIAGNIGLLVGVVLVVLQIQQNSDLTRDQLYQDRWTDLMAFHAARMGDDVSSAIAKALESPGDMTTAEHEAMDAYLGYYTTYILRNRALGQRGITGVNDWRTFLDVQYDGYNSSNEHIFGNPYAKAWLTERLRHGGLPSEFESHVSAVSESTALNRIEFISKEIESAKKQSRGC